MPLAALLLPSPLALRSVLSVGPLGTEYGYNLQEPNV